MLKLKVLGVEYFSEVSSEFITTQDVDLEVEHSLVSLSKWESKYQFPFLGPKEKTKSEILDYISMMIISKNPPEEILNNFSEKNFKEVTAYIESKQSATTFGDMPTRGARSEIITSELIYYWMVAFTIPFECENWHLNRLFALIRICNVKQSKPKNVPRHELAQRNRELNEQRKAQLGTSG